MKELFNKIISIGIKPSHTEAIAEKIKLVNGISLLGVPVCSLYIVMFGFTGYFTHMLFFMSGIIIFTLPILFNAVIGLNFARFFISIMAPAFFCVATIISGREAGFYLGFLVIAVPPLLIYDKMYTSVIFIIVCVSFLALSILGLMVIPPITKLPFAMAIYLINLFTVLNTSLVMVFLFKSELSESRVKLQEKNKEVTDSIHYARRIQNTLLAHSEFLQQNLPNHFILFKPKDIVSGDFYWATIKENKFYLAICDSTGHGVPGAFMSLLNISFLNEAITEKNILNPNEIFNHSRLRLIENISQEGGKDGMDGILVCIDKAKNKITYSAANNAPLVIRNVNGKKELIYLEADKMPVGKGESSNSFTLRNVEVQKGDTIYLFTDGYADQFGGPKGKKFRYKQLEELLLANCDKSLDEQKQILEKTFEDWRGKLEQIDDVLIMGIKV